MSCLNVLSAESLRGYGHSFDSACERDVSMAWGCCDLFVSVKVNFPCGPSDFNVCGSYMYTPHDLYLLLRCIGILSSAGWVGSSLCGCGRVHGGVGGWRECPFMCLI